MPLPHPPRPLNFLRAFSSSFCAHFRRVSPRCVAAHRGDHHCRDPREEPRVSRRRRGGHKEPQLGRRDPCGLPREVQEHDGGGAGPRGGRRAPLFIQVSGAASVNGAKRISPHADGPVFSWTASRHLQTRISSSRWRSRALKVPLFRPRTTFAILNGLRACSRRRMVSAHTVGSWSYPEAASRTNNQLASCSVLLYQGQTMHPFPHPLRLLLLAIAAYK
eukprot:3859614-Pleurochrysis_carterae.AAC.7